MSINIPPTARQIIFIIAFVICLMPMIDPPLALLFGFILAQIIGHPFIEFNSKATNWLLKISVIGLGFGVNLHHAIEAGKDGLFFTAFSIFIVLLVGFILGKGLKIDHKISFLISTGTAICGGSAIAAISPIVKATEKQMSVALGAIFILNSLSLLIFPSIGHGLHMTQHQFGFWCAIAIHDTSSVVGAATKYGQEALQIATTIKLERALWIIPLSIATAFFAKGENKKIYIPYFIGLFVVAMCCSTYLPAFQKQFSMIVWVAKKGLTVTLFLIGAGLSLDTLKTVGAKPFLQAVLLWLLISGVSLMAIMTFE